MRVYSSAIDIQQFESTLSDWPRHWHEEVQVVASRSGLSRHFLKGSSESVLPDDVFVVNSGEVHTAIAESDSCWQFVTAHLPTVLFSRFWEENGGRGTRSLCFRRSVFRHYEVHRMLTCLYQGKSENLSPLYGDHCLQELIGTLWSISREPLRLPKSLTQSCPSLAAARDYLHENTSAKVTVKQLADLAGISEFHFCRQFSRRFGLSPHAYQIQLRLVAAKRLLRNGHSIDAVYPAVGFSSQSHLTRAFLRVTGLTPARFQKTSKIVPNAVLS